MRKLIIFLILLFSVTKILSQTNNWTKSEKKYYETVESLFTYYNTKTYDSTQRNYIFSHFIYFDNILSDTSKTRLQKRLKYFDALFGGMIKYVDSIGLKNLDAKPTRFFASDEIFFSPFSNGRELNELLPQTLTYFDKREPEKPLGVLLFELNSNKLFAWVIINQGGYRYFLTFNLL